MRSTPSRSPLITVIAVALGIGVSQAPAMAQESRSAPLAAELASLMAERQLDAAAAKDTIDDDRFVAALAFPGQLLVVSARYSVPAAAVSKIGKEEYREVYLDLNTAAIDGTKWLVADAGADGLRAESDTIDTVDNGAGILLLDNDPGGQQLSRDEYRSAFADADEQYARMLGALLAAIR